MALVQVGQSARGTLKQGSIALKVARACTCCGAPNPDFLPYCLICDAMAVIEDLGVVAYYHRNPLRRWAFAFRRWLRS
jgi:hypothetical protein